MKRNVQDVSENDWEQSVGGIATTTVSRVTTDLFPYLKPNIKFNCTRNSLMDHTSSPSANIEESDELQSVISIIKMLYYSD